MQNSLAPYLGDHLHDHGKSFDDEDSADKQAPRVLVPISTATVPMAPGVGADVSP